MVLPRGRPIYKGMKTKVVNLESLIEELEEEAFSGYIQLEFEDETGTIFIERGRVVAAVSDGSSVSLTHLIEKASVDKQGILNVYSLPDEMVSLLSSTFNVEPRIKDFPFEVVDVERLLDRLSRDRFTGALVVEDASKGATMMGFFFSGDPVEFLYEDASVTLTGEDAMEKLYELNSSKSAFMSIVDASFEGDRTVQAVSLEDVVEDIKRLFAAVMPELLSELSLKDFKRVALELAERYPFLDPFDPDVYFEERGIVIRDDVSRAELIEGLSALLSKLASSLSEKTRKSVYASAVAAVSNRDVVKPILDALVGG